MPAVSGFLVTAASTKRLPRLGVIAGHSRPKDGVAILAAYDPVIQLFERWITGSRRFAPVR
jgi:hypothetical protein